MKPALQISLLIACTVWAASPASPEAEDLQVQQTITDLAEAYMSSINEQISDIAVHTGGALAWATYQDRVTIAAHGGTMDAMTLCTAIFRKTLTGWVYRHEHCSSNTLDKGADHGELTKLARNLDRTASK